MAGIYIYGFLRNDCFSDIINVLLQSKGYSIEYNDISAIVSDTEEEKIEYSDREALGRLLVEHQEMIEKMMNAGCSDIIPMQLGTIVNSRNDVISILKNAYNIILQGFKVTAGVEEFDLVVVWNNFMDHLRSISDTPKIKKMKEDVLDKKSCDYADSIKVGKFIKEQIDEDNNKAGSDIVNALIPLCRDLKKHETMNDEMVLNSAFLVPKESKRLFMEMIDKLDIKYGDHLNFKIVGPLPCYSFYTVECKGLNKKEIDEAAGILGIDHDTSESDIKKAYHQKAGLTHPDKNYENPEENDEGFIKITNAYKTMLEYSNIIKQSPDAISGEPLYLVKIKK
jgi:hypothetical protein